MVCHLLMMYQKSFFSCFSSPFFMPMHYFAAACSVLAIL